jgi:polar amino acid transport system substrate-binding protein
MVVARIGFCVCKLSVISSGIYTQSISLDLGRVPGTIRGVRIRLLSLLSVILLCLVLPGAGLGSSMAQTPGVQPLRSLQDLHTARIGVLTGSAQDEYARRDFPKAPLLHFNSFPDLLLGVTSGKVDVGLYSYAHTLEAMKTAPLLGFLEEKAITSNMGIAFHPDNRALREKFNAFLAQVQSNGVQADMNQRWLEEKRYEMPVIANPSPSGELRVGMTSTLGLPFIGLKDRELIGYEVEMAQRFAAHLGMNLRIVDLELGSLIASLVTGKIDMIGTNLVMTEERSKRVAFSNKTIDFYSSAFALKSRLAVGAQPGAAVAPTYLSTGVPQQLRSLKDIETARIALLAGSTYDEHAKKFYPKATVLHYKTPPDVVVAVTSGKADVAFYNLESAIELFKRAPELDFLEPKAYASPLALGFNQRNDALRESFNAFLKQFRASGGYDDMVKRWFTDRRYEQPVIPNAGTGNELRVGITATKGLPYVTVQDRRLIGYEVELAERFAAHLGRPLRLVDMEFSGQIAALDTGKIDVIGSTLVITEERAKRVDFSDPILDFYASVIALKTRLASHASATAGGGAAAEPPRRETLLERLHANLIQENRFELILEGLGVTAVISVLAAVFGTLLGALVCFMRMSKQRLLSAVAGFYIWLLRGIPVLVLLMIIYYIVFASVEVNAVAVAAVAFGLNMGAYSSEMFRSAIQSVDRGQTEAGIAGGFTKAQTFRLIVLPQAMRQALPVYKGELISLIKMTSVVGYIAVQDLTKASDIIRSRTFDAFVPLIVTAIIYLAIAWAITWALDRVEWRLTPRHLRLGARRDA